MRCQECGAENRPGRKFCAQCGSALLRACPYCRSTNEPGAKFCGECGASLNGPGPQLTIQRQTAPAPIPTDTSAERRQVTVMFVDLVGSTGLSTRLDPEDLREVLATYHALVAEVIKAHGGYVAPISRRRGSRLFRIPREP